MGRETKMRRASAEPRATVEENRLKTERARRKPCQEQTPLKPKRVEVWPETDVHKIKWKQTRHLRAFENRKAAKRFPTLGAR